METLQITRQAAIKAHSTAGRRGKLLLETLFGKTLFAGKITDRVKTFDDALAIVGCSDHIQDLIEYAGNDKETKAAQAQAKLSIIAKALNEGWTPDWNNSNQYKYHPVFDMSGSGFSGSDYATWCTFTSVGSRLCYKSGELAKYAGTQFRELYKDLFTL